MGTASILQAHDVLDAFNPKLVPQLARWKEIVSKDVAALEEMMRNKNVPVIFVPPSQPESAPGK